MAEGKQVGPVASMPGVWHWLGERRRGALGIGLCVLGGGLLLIDAGVLQRGTAADSLLANVFTWVWLLVFLGYGYRHLSFSSGLLRWARDASYPVYILHQTVIIAGQVSNFQLATTRDAKPAYGFLIKDQAGTVKVVALGQAEVREGDLVIAGELTPPTTLPEALRDLGQKTSEDGRVTVVAHGRIEHLALTVEDVETAYERVGSRERRQRSGEPAALPQDHL